MINYRKFKTLVKPVQCSKHLTTLVKQDSSNDPGDDFSIIQWLTSTSTTPPPITHRITFTSKPTTSVTSQPNQKSTFQIASPITPAQLLSSSAKLLSSNHLHRSPNTLPPLTIEYSSPNIAKPLHMGHLRSTLTGSYVRNVAEFAGHECRSVCFLGDWGRQFGVLHAGVLENLETEDFEQYVSRLTLAELLRIYVTSSSKCETDKEFTGKALCLSAELEQNFDDNSNGKFLWTHTRNLTVQHLKSCYSDLCISFNTFEGESTYRKDSPHTKYALDLLKQSNLTHLAEDGTLRVKTGDNSSILLKRDNSSVYLLRDIACALHRSAQNPDNRFVYVVDQGQSSHFKNLFEVLRNLNVSSSDSESQIPFSSTHTHVPFGKVSGMSTRQGTFTLLSEVIEQGTQLMHESRRKSRNARNTDDISVSQRLAVSGLIVNALKQRRTKPYAFDWNEALRSSGNSGVALQYTIARLGSLVKRTSGSDHIDERDVSRKLELLLKDGKPEVTDLIIALMNFEDTFWRSYTTLEPSTLVNYSFNLSDKVSKALSTLNVLNEKNPDLADSAIWIFQKSKQTLENSMRILGIQTVGEF